MASEEGKKITLRSSDGEEFVVEEAVAMLSQTIRHMIEDECAESAIPLPNVNSRILTKVIEYCKKHVKCTPVASATGDEIAVEKGFWYWDYETVDVDRSVLFDSMLSQTIRHMTEDECAAESAIPLPNVNFGILAKVIQHCKKHTGYAPVLSEIGQIEAAKKASKKAAKKAVEEELRSWDADFVKVDQSTLFDLILAAGYLNIKGLLDLTIGTVAGMMTDRTPEEIRKTFNIENDLTPEEEEEEWDFKFERFLLLQDVDIWRIMSP